LGVNLTAEDIRALECLPHTKVFPIQSSDTHNVCLQKPLAIRTAETDIIIWMDADCIVTNNLDAYYTTPDDKFQIRFRQNRENAQVYRDLYQANDTLGAIPARVLQIWQQDVADETEPKIQTVAQTNCFVLSRNHLPFIDLWHSQMEKVIPAHVKSVYNKESIAYSMTDESTINSLLAFSSLAPRIYEYQMDKNPDGYLAHFGLKPKPWQHWTTQSLHYYDEVFKLIQWGKAQGYRLPALPPSFLPRNRLTETLRANFVSKYRLYRYTLSTQARYFLKRWRKA
jgi:hypothetical protein